MTYYKTIIDGYIVSVGVNCGNTVILESEYNGIMNVINSRPTSPDGYGYRLTESLEWEPYQLPTVDDEASEADIASAMMEVFG